MWERAAKALIDWIAFEEGEVGTCFLVHLGN